MCTLITASAKFEFTASLGALKSRKPYKENQSSSSYSETIGHTCFKVWAGVIVHYSMPIFIQIFLLEIIFQIKCSLAWLKLTVIKRQFRSSITALDFFSKSRHSNSYWKKDSDGFRFPTQSSYSWPNLGLEWSICSKSRVVSSCLPGMMDIHSSIHKYFSRCHNSDIFPIF